MISVSKAAELVDHVGDAVKSSETVVIRDTMIDAFNTISEDRQWIHGAGAAPRIVPANLLISLIPRLLQNCIEVSVFSRCLTVKYENIRFKSPVVAGDTVGLSVVVTDVRTRFDNTFVTATVTLFNVADEKELLIAEVTDCYEAP